ncbi:MAG: Uma2 family endonuclease [Pirellulales bacterium]|nr:Uma2 family endonuclease [Pirellulales bacterium]
MSTAPTPYSAPPLVFPAGWTLAQVQDRLGNVPAERIRVNPPLGTATIDDAIRLCESKESLCEWVDGILVDKAMGVWESGIAAVLIQLIRNFLDEQPLGFVAGEAGMLRILPDRMRIPDVSFIRWERFPDRKLPREAAFRIAPDLAVEILSPGNTKREMELKLAEYLNAGVQLVWYIEPTTRTAIVHRPGEPARSIDADGMLDGAGVLPGFTVRLGEIFARAERGAGGLKA